MDASKNTPVCASTFAVLTVLLAAPRQASGGAAPGLSLHDARARPAEADGADAGRLRIDNFSATEDALIGATSPAAADEGARLTPSRPSRQTGGQPFEESAGDRTC
ncbi:MAG TPA: hypothetical protein VII63_12360 [Caulobacteraceae bacterium]